MYQHWGSLSNSLNMDIKDACNYGKLNLLYMYNMLKIVLIMKFSQITVNLSFYEEQLIYPTSLNWNLHDLSIILQIPLHSWELHKHSRCCLARKIRFSWIIVYICKTIDSDKAVASTVVKIHKIEVSYHSTIANI